MTETPFRVMVLSAAIESSNLDDAARHWERALIALEEVIPGLESPYVGLCIARARGPARYYGSEQDAAQAWLRAASEQGFTQARLGIANGIFTATQAAHTSHTAPEIYCPFPGVRIVPSAHTAAFLGALPIESVAMEDLTEVLAELGIHTLGALAALPESAVHERFGNQGIEAHRLARGASPRNPMASGLVRGFPEHRASLVLESPLDDNEQLAFVSRTHSDSFLLTLARQEMVCTELRIELIDDAGAMHARDWAHPTHFTSMDITNRIRWQAADIPSASERHTAGIIEVLLAAKRVARAADHEPGLWSTAPDERIHHHLTRLQNVLGFENVCMGVLTGGRLSGARQALLPWGSVQNVQSRPHAPNLPWPGAIPGLPPSTVLTHPLPASLWDANSQAVHIDDEDFFTTDPAFLLGTVDHTSRHAISVTAWSKPWPLNEAWWVDTHISNMSYRTQLILEDGSAWLLRYQRSTAAWIVEGRYD